RDRSRSSFRPSTTASTSSPSQTPATTVRCGRPVAATTYATARDPTPFGEGRRVCESALRWGSAPTSLASGTSQRSGVPDLSSPSNNLEKPKGALGGKYSTRVNDQYRVVFNLRSPPARRRRRPSPRVGESMIATTCSPEARAEEVSVG